MGQVDNKPAVSDVYLLMRGHLIKSVTRCILQKQQPLLICYSTCTRQEFDSQWSSLMCSADKFAAWVAPLLTSSRMLHITTIQSGAMERWFVLEKQEC